MSTPAFTMRRKVMFQHCDPAGIVFYPRYFEFLNAVVEEWFEAGLGVSFRELHMVRGDGAPLAHCEVDFHAPSRLGDELMFELHVEKVGAASLHLRVTATCGDEARLSAQLILVHMDLESARATPFPDDLRASLSRCEVA